MLIDNDLNELSRLGEWISAWTSQHTIPDATAGYVDLCATEAVTNVMTHAYDDAATHQIALRLERDGDRVRLLIEDDGKAFDPTAVVPPAPATLQNERIGGWGISIIRRLTEKLTYKRSDGRNHLTLVFRARSQGAT